MTRLNRITSANCPSNRFITFFFCILDGDTGELTYCNAGHNPPVIVRADGAHEELPGGGPVVGILPTIEYREYLAHLDVGDVLVIYSDGVTEAKNPAGKEFDIAGLARSVTPHRDAPAATIVAEINQAVAAFTAGRAPVRRHYADRCPPHSRLIVPVHATSVALAKFRYTRLRSRSCFFPCYVFVTIM